MSLSDATLVERDLGKVQRMKATGCCFVGGRIRDVDLYLRQYAGVIVGGRRYIYINAFAAGLLDEWPEQVVEPQWKRVAFITCDGGRAFWGALYDPETRRFSELSINGSA